MKPIEGIIKKVNIKKVAIATFIFGIIFYIINLSPIGIEGLLKITGGANILDFEHGYSMARAYEVFSQLGESGRIFYLHKIIPMDFIFPISYMLFYSAWMSFFIKQLKSEESLLKWLLTIPVINMLSDWLENMNIILMLNQYPTELPVVCALGNIATRIKFICVSLNIIILLLLGLGLVVKRLLIK